MNAVEIEEAVSRLASEPFDAAEFPFAFLEAFGAKATTIKRLRKGDTNASDIEKGVLQRNNIHMAVCPEGRVGEALRALKQSPATAKAKAKFALATDGVTLEAEDLVSAETVACDYAAFADHFGFFLPLAGITTVKQVRDNPIDIQATSRLNRLYVELLKENGDWGTDARRHDMNQFMARLIFCFFAEDTEIFSGDDLFTDTVERMSGGRSGDTHGVIAELFRAMDTPTEERADADLPRWADAFPYVNGGLFDGAKEVPRFSRTARSYLLHAGRLDWKAINPDIFGSMIQAVAEDEERGELGMHYTSVPNILKVLDPLFLDDLRAQLEKADDNPRKLLNLRKRLASIRVFDPACGSGNFLVVAYKQMREIEATVNARRGDGGAKSGIPLTNFRGIEIRDFAAEIARLALIIAEYQCDEMYRGQREALADVLPLDALNWITRGNALRLDWESVCPPVGGRSDGVKLRADDLLHTPLDEAEIDFNNAGSETYICGNPPYKGSQWQTAEQRADLRSVFEGRAQNWKSLDYVAAWFLKAADYGARNGTTSAFVATNSICQGRQVETLWSPVFATGQTIAFAHASFKWANLASHNAGVTVAVVGIAGSTGRRKRLFDVSADGKPTVRVADHINAYLIATPEIIVQPNAAPLANLPEMSFGNMPNDGGFLLCGAREAKQSLEKHNVPPKFIRPFVGSQEFIHGTQRRCVWVAEKETEEARRNRWLSERFEAVRKHRAASSRATTKALAETPHRFGEVRQTGAESAIIVPRHTSEKRSYLPVGLLHAKAIVADSALAIYDSPIWCIALIASRLHLVWIATVCGKLKTDYRYSNTLGWNTFPLPKLTEKNKNDLTTCAENILLAREAHFPATIAELYDPDSMPDDLRAAHDRNDEVLERVYIGRRFRNDTERLEKLFELYARMTADGKRLT